MLETIVFGLNHKTAPIHIREKFFLNPLQQDLFLSELKTHPQIAEAFVLSTCNRTEIYLSSLNSTSPLPLLSQLISEIKKIDRTDSMSRAFYLYRNAEAVNHFLKVTSGLDSLVLGEKQILGQVKTAVERARAKGLLDRNFNILTNIAIRCAKKAQNETDIAYGGSSVSWAAMSMAESQLGTLEDKSILIIGAGKMGELTMEQIRHKGVCQIYLMNRTGQAAESLAETCGGTAVAFTDIKETLSEVDVCICSASAPHYILDKNIMTKVMALRNQRKLIMIDISMPRNIDPLVGSLSGVHLSTIDDLDKTVGENMRKRQSAVAAVEQIISQKISEYYEKLSKLNNSEELPESIEA